MDKFSDQGFEAMRRAAHDVTRNWSPSKAAMALRAAGWDAPDRDRESLDVIAAELGVSRETVRRARNELLHGVHIPLSESQVGVVPPPTESSVDSPATARALRRVLTMTGPLAWDEVLSAWARAGGKPPYSPLPADVASMREWVGRAGGLVATPKSNPDVPVTVAADSPEELDQVGQFFYDHLRGKPAGVDRNILLESAESAGLKATTIATMLSQHPAVTRIGRGTWALRGHQRGPDPLEPVRSTRRAERVRPTTFSWSNDGLLQIEFSIPRGPSPVVAVPKAVAELVEAREFEIEAEGRPARISVRNARLWGFGPLVSEAGLVGGSRAVVALNLISSTATFRPAHRKGAVS